MILERIKKETEKNHILLESVPLLSHLPKNTISIHLYLEVLKKFYGFFKPIEDALNHIDQIGDFLPDFHERRKSDWLTTDMKNLRVPEHGICCEDTPEVKDLSDAFGILYVMEGSTLGGRVISRNLKEALDLDKDNGASFFNGYGPQTGEKWSIFRQALINYSIASNNDDVIIEKARQTFHKLYVWMNQ